MLSGFSAIFVGRLLDATHNNYTLLFFIGAAAYVVATLVIHFLLPRHRAESDRVDVGGGVGYRGGARVG